VQGICPGTALVVEYKPAGYAVFFQPPLAELVGVTPTTWHDDGVCGRPGAGAIDRSSLATRSGHSVSLVCRTKLPYGVRLLPPARGRPARVTAFTALGRALVEAVVGRRGSTIRWDPRACRRA
jgi:hypothetical protein